MEEVQTYFFPLLGPDRARGGDGQVPDLQARERSGPDPSRDPLPAHVPLPPPVHDCPPQDTPGGRSDLQGQNRLHQHRHRRPPGGDAVSAKLGLFPQSL